MIEPIFQFFNSFIILIWLLMFIRPYGKWTLAVLNSKWLWIFSGAIYATLLVGYSSKLDWMAMANPTYEGITQLFAVPEVAAIAWIHLLIFDLLAGRYIVLKGMAQKRFILPFLILTLMAGPLGFALYFIYDSLLDYRRGGQYNNL
ncbi:MAG: hypothetical protein RLZZ267_263 [Bacillota bacterium]|jgi:hypothetical protein